MSERTDVRKDDDPHPGTGHHRTEHDMRTDDTERPVEELIGWKRIKPGYDLAWHGDGATRVRAEVDDLVDWLRSQEAKVWLGAHSETDLTVTPVDLCVIKAGQHTHRPKGGDLRGALVAAVRAVSETTETTT